jgi:hypothetical protein
MRDEYDFTKGVRGKYAKRFEEGTNLVLLEPEVAKYFPTAQAVNTALRSLIAVGKVQLPHNTYEAAVSQQTKRTITGKQRNQ